MFGTILGDIIGSPYEFDQGDKTKAFPLFSEYSSYTDDTVMTVAVAEAFLDAGPNDSDEQIKKRLVRYMQYSTPDADADSTPGFIAGIPNPITATVMDRPCVFLL